MFVKVRVGDEGVTSAPPTLGKPLCRCTNTLTFFIGPPQHGAMLVEPDQIPVRIMINRYLEEKTRFRRVRMQILLLMANLGEKLCYFQLFTVPATISLS